MTFALSAALLAAVASAPAAARAQIVTNGSFELPVQQPGTYTTYSAGQVLGGWTVAQGSVDLIGAGFWQASNGVQSVDMSGVSAGTIYQDLATVGGARYDLLFDLAGNPTFQDIKTLQVFWGAVGSPALVGTFTFNTAGFSLANMGWRTVTISGLLAPSATSRLQFVSLDNSNAGPALDNVRVVAALASVPEPSTWALLGTGLLGVVGVARRKRTA